MPKNLAPGVYIQEVSFRSAPIEAWPTSTVGFVGAGTRATMPELCTSFAGFQRTAGSDTGENLRLAARGFFENGGKRCFVVRAVPGIRLQTAFQKLAAERISIVCCPDEDKLPGAAAVMAAHCEQLKDRICILHSPQPVIPDAGHEPPARSSYAAYYYPWITVPKPGGGSVTIPPAGHVAGLYAQTDINRGVWTIPAGLLVGVSAAAEDIGTARSDVLAARGINVLRSNPGGGVETAGARTTLPDTSVSRSNPVPVIVIRPAPITISDAKWKYMNLRRFLIFLEQSITNGLQWVVFEPNDPALCISVKGAIAGFLEPLWKSGALHGGNAEEAYFVRCDHTTMTPADLKAGRFVALIGLALLRPAEFFFLRVTCQTK